jgi:NAD(P)-dependent dehydrogenase (short-subunit alcohol dehydrogenase family)
MIYYGFTKTAQLAIARGTAETIAGTDVTCNAVLSGPTWSEGVSHFVAQMAEESGTDEDHGARVFSNRAPDFSIETLRHAR